VLNGWPRGPQGWQRHEIPKRETRLKSRVRTHMQGGRSIQASCNIHHMIKQTHLDTRITQMHACLYTNLHDRLHTHPRKHTRNIQAHMHAVHIYGSRNDTAPKSALSPGLFFVYCNSSLLNTF